MSAFDGVSQKLRSLDLSRTSTGWSMAHVLEHCAQSIEYSLDGFPSLKPAPFRFVARFVMRGFLKDGAMKHDLAAVIPGAPALSSSDAAQSRDRLLAAIAKFDASTSTKPHFAYGDVAHDDYARLHAMHIEDHLRAFGA
jgi:hypothetical protein